MPNYYDPFKEMRTLMNQSLNQSFGKGIAMPMDLYRDGDQFVAEIELPGVDANSIDIDIEDRTITVRAERPAADTDGRQWVARERSFGTVARQITVGAGLALDRVSASYNDGMLCLTIPVAEEAKPRKVTVQRANDHQEIKADVTLTQEKEINGEKPAQELHDFASKSE